MALQYELFEVTDKTGVTERRGEEMSALKAFILYSRYKKKSEECVGGVLAFIITFVIFVSSTQRDSCIFFFIVVGSHPPPQHEPRLIAGVTILVLAWNAIYCYFHNVQVCSEMPAFGM